MLLRILDHMSHQDLLVGILSTMGGHPRIIPRVLCSLYYFLGLVMMLIGSAFLMFDQNVSDNGVYFANLATFVGCVYFMSIGAITNFHATDLNTLMGNFFTPKDEDQDQEARWQEIIENMRKKPVAIVSDPRFRLLFAILLTYNSMGYLSVMTIPLVNLRLQIVQMGEAFSFLFPQSFPWDVNNPTGYISAYVVQVFSAFPMQILMFSTTTFNVLVLCSFMNQFAELIAVTNHLKAVEHEYVIEQPRRSGRCYSNLDELVVCCIKQHQIIVRNFNIYKKWFDQIFTAELSYYIFDFLLLGYAVVATPNLGFQARASLLLLNMTLSLYISCLIGNYFSTMNNWVRDTLWSLPWDNGQFDKTGNQLIHIFMLQTGSELELNAFGVFQASLIHFTNIVKTSYSYLNILIAVMK